MNNMLSASGNPLITDGRDLPWLQDDATEDVWTLWGVNPYDVIILNGENEVVTVYNLLGHDLGVPANYAELRTLLLTAAAAE